VNPAGASVMTLYLVLIRSFTYCMKKKFTVLSIHFVDPTTPENFQLTSISPSPEVLLHWTPNSEVDLNGYKIYGGTLENASELIATVPGSAIRFVHKELLWDKRYYYQISAIDLSGNDSTPTQILSIIFNSNQKKI